MGKNKKDGKFLLFTNFSVGLQLQQVTFLIPRDVIVNFPGVEIRLLKSVFCLERIAHYTTRQDKTMLYLESYTVLCTSTLSK